MSGGSAPDPRGLLRNMFDAAIASAQPARCIAAHLPAPPRGRLIVIGAGKASAAMARAVELQWPGPLCGIVVTRYGYAVPCERIEVLEGAHPVPDAAGMHAAQRILERVQGLSEDDLVLCLISGGGSALLPLPAPGFTLDLKQSMSRALLARGHHQRDELRAPSSVGHQGRQAGGGMPPGPRAHPADFGCAGR